MLGRSGMRDGRGVCVAGGVRARGHGGGGACMVVGMNGKSMHGGCGLHGKGAACVAGGGGGQHVWQRGICMAGEGVYVVGVWGHRAWQVGGCACWEHAWWRQWFAWQRSSMCDRGHMHGRGHAWGHMHGRAHAWQWHAWQRSVCVWWGVCVAGEGVCVVGACVAGDVCGRGMCGGGAAWHVYPSLAEAMRYGQ